MNQEEQEVILSEGASNFSENPGPDGEQFTDVPPSDLLFTYLQQCADSLIITQSDLDDLLNTPSHGWILTSATDNGRDILTELSIWTVDTLGEIQSQNLLLLRLSEEHLSFSFRDISIRQRNKDDIKTIVSASVVRFPSKYVNKIGGKADPILIVKADESKAFAVLYGERHHPEGRIHHGPSLLRYGVNSMNVGSRLNETAERIIIDNQAGSILDYSLENEESLFAAVTEKSALDNEDEIKILSSHNAPSLDHYISIPKNVIHNIFSIIQLNIRTSQIIITLVTAMLAGLLMASVASVPLPAPLTNSIGLIAFGILIGTMLHGDLADG